jgi:uncharacterized protein
MPLTINLRHLEEKDVRLAGKLPVEDLDLGLNDELIRATKPLDYELEVQQMEDSLLLTGSLRLPLDCECVRCLRPFQYDLEMPEWTCHVPLEGEEAAPVHSDIVDLTPYVREDILLDLPQHPLCEAECSGLPEASVKKPETARVDEPEAGSSAWSELNKLKF